MNYFEIIIAGLFVSLIVYLLRRTSNQNDPSSSLTILNETVQKLHDRLDQMTESLSNKAVQQFQISQQQQQHSTNIISEVKEKLARLDETNKQVLGFSEQLGQLQDILKNPKQRGILGEYWLETLLSQVLSPKQYKMQHLIGKNEDGEDLIADAAIFVKNYTVPIDAKFSLENYNRAVQEADADRRSQFEREFKLDVKKRIDEAAKYIQPDQGTVPFAFMFVPAEGIFHNLLTSSVGGVAVNQRDLVEYAFQKHVMIVSPTSFYAYLQTVLMGLHALQIEESVGEILKNVGQLERHLKSYEAMHEKVGKHLATAVGAYEDASGEWRKVHKDILRVLPEGAPAIPAPVDDPKVMG
ncbi:DNA recombination protein RmuC [Candidatus Uhrbacteria bacterium]|nr:DNA recombination protein RmuC [Candidatus Uhrbacteria bacterium]